MRRWWVWLSISVALLALLVWRTKPWEVLALGARPLPLIGVLFLDAIVVLAWAFRSASLMRAVGRPMSVGALVPIVSFANTINNLTPASSGEAVRAVILNRRHGVPYAPATAVILAERFWAIWIMGVTAGAAAVGTVIPAPPILTALAWLAAAVAALLPVIAHRAGVRPTVVAARVIGGRGDATSPPDGPTETSEAAVGADSDAGAVAEPAAPRRPGLRTRIARLLADVDEHLDSILRSPSATAGFLAWTAAVFVAFAVQLWLVLVALGVEVPLAGAWAALGLATIAGVLSALPFGLGATDLVLTGLLVQLGVDPSVAAAATLLLRATVTLPLGLVGTASWIALNRGSEATPAGTGR
jgi:uncharacterized membrane protein YbhN (UPF0104 family)